jgi:hypothetical protein
MVENENKDVKKDVFRPNINGSLEQRRMEAQKRKDLPNGVVFSTIDGVTEMHPLDKVYIVVDDRKSNIHFEGTVGDFVKMCVSDIVLKDKSIELQKKAILSLDERLKHLEKVVKDYGLE